MTHTPQVNIVGGASSPSEALSVAIHSLLQNFDEADALGGIARELRRFGRYELKGHISAILEDRDALRALAQHSYLHGNGFYKIPLIKSQAHTVRLHIWRSDASGEENLHSHRWPFASSVVLGSLTSEVWVDAVDVDARSFPELLYNGKEEDFLETGQCRIRLKEIRRHITGEQYWMRADELHRIINVGDQLTVTLMMRPGNTRSWARNILLKAAIPHAKPVYLTTETLRPVLQEVAAALGEREAAHD